MSKAKRQLTNLESTALGIIWKRGGCSAYEVMAEYSTSLASQFRSGAGSTYPLIARLHKDRLIKRKPAKRGRQRKSIYTISEKGRKHLESWLCSPLAESEYCLVADPIRTRVYFLKLLPPKKRLAFLAETHARFKSELKKLNEAMRVFVDENNTYAIFAMKGAIKVMKARINWIAELRREMAE